MSIEISKAPVDATYQRHLEESFPEWGGAVASRWYFERQVGGPAADLLSVREAGKLVAGIALTYKPLRLANDATVLAAILTGAWTAPHARRRGHLFRFVDEAPAIARQRGAVLTLAFLSGDRSSKSGLHQAGYATVPTRYLTASNPAADSRVSREVVHCRSVPVDRETVEELFHRYQASGAGEVRPAYPDARHFASQFLGRPGPVELLRLEGSGWISHGWAVVEPVGETDRLQLLLAPVGRRALCLEALLQRAARRGRRFFHYHSSAELDALWPALGLAVKPGQISVRVSDASALAGALGRSPEEPAPATSEPLLDPASPWYLGPWRFQPGDRM